MASIQLNGETRTGTGKGPARRLRREGKIPAVYYGAGEESIPFAIRERDLEAIRKTHSLRNAILDLTIGENGAPERKAIIKELQRHPLSGHIEHVDFQHISLTERIRVTVPVHLIGLPVGVKDAGGILEHIVRDVEVECLPGDIPEVINVDVAALGIGDSIHVRDLTVERVTLVAEPERTIATVVPPTVFEEKKVEEAEGVAEPELIKKEGAAEEGEAASEGKSEGKKEKKEEKEKK